jgi:O-antigen/teichoic acid export membrane protein
MAAAAVLRLLSPAVLVFAVMNPFSAFLRATGRVGRSLKIALVICPVVIAGIMAGLHNGPTGVAAGYSSAMVLLFVPVMAWVIYGTGITFGDYWDSIKQPLISGVIAGFAGGLFKFVFHSAFTSIPLLFIGLTFSFAVYVCVLFFAMGQKDMYVDLLSHLLSRNRSLPTEN